MSQQKSRTWRQRATQVLAGGPATLSKHWDRYPANAPTFLVNAEGPYVWGENGRRYIDCVSALGPILLGHNHPAVVDAVCAQAERLSCSTLSTPLEVECAERLVSIIPGAEQVRFASNGADVTNAAVKVARYVTGQKHMIYCGYHGGFSDYLSTTTKAGGVLPSLAASNHQVPWRDWAALDDALAVAAASGPGNALAGLMLEVPPEVQGVTPEETTAVLQRYADAAHTNGGLFLLDEIVTGLRYGLGGAQAYYDVQADLITMCKALGNGLPCTALLGSRDLMRVFTGGQVFLSTTFGANPLSLAACQATLTTLMETDALEALQLYGNAVLTHLDRELAWHDLPASVRGNSARFVVDWQAVPGVVTADALRTLWLQELVTRGVLAGVPWFPMTCYTQEVVQTIADAVTGTCGVLQAVVQGRTPISEALTGPVIRDVFTRYERPQA